jgi:hypothetical protein
LKIVTLKEGLTSAMLRRKNLQEFTFRVFATKICLPYGTGMWSTVDEIDILEMFEG